MRPNTIRVRDAVLTACCGESLATSEVPPHADLQQSSDRWWNVVHVMCRLLGTRPFLCVLLEAGALWSQGEHVVRSSPVTKPAVVVNAADGASSLPGDAAPKQRGGRQPKTAASQSTVTADVGRPASKHPTKYDHLILDDSADAAAAQLAFEAWRVAVTAMPLSSARQYIMGSLLKVSGFFERHTTALQEYSLATKQDPMTASLASTQGLSILQEHDAPLRELERTADRMFPFINGRDLFFDMLKHANMANALVVCTMVDDGVVESSAAHRHPPPSTRAVLGPPSPCYVLDFLALQHGARLEVCQVAPHTSDAVGVDPRRAAVKTQSLRVVGDGVSLHNGCLGVVAIPLDTVASSSSARGARFVGLAGLHVKVLAFSAADVLLAGGGTSPAIEVPAGAEAPSEKNVTRRGPRTQHRRNTVAANAARVAAAAARRSFNVDLEDLRDRVVQDARSTDAPSYRSARASTSLPARFGHSSGILARDVLEPRRRLTRHTSKLIAMQRLDTSMHNHTTADSSGSSDEGDVIIEGVAAAAGTRPPTYELDAHRLNGDAQLSTVRAMMCFGVRAAADLQKRTEGPLPKHKSEVPEVDSGAKLIPLDARMALVALLVLHMLPSTKFVEVTRLASPEIAWLVVERILGNTRRCISEIGLITAGYALTLVEPPAMCLPLWYSLLVGLYHRSMLWPSSTVKEEPGTTSSHSISATGFSQLWGLWQAHVMQHPLLPSVFHDSVWRLLEHLGVDQQPSQSSAGSGGVKVKSEKKVSLKRAVPSSVLPEPSVRPPPRSPTVSEASVVELDHMSFHSARPCTRRTAALELQRLQQLQQSRGVSEESVLSVVVEEEKVGQLMALHRKRGRTSASKSTVELWDHSLRRRGGRREHHPANASASLSDVLVRESLSVDCGLDDHVSVASSTTHLPVKMEEDDAQIDEGATKDAALPSSASWVSRCHALWMYLANSSAEGHMGVVE
jgi:hypothetical protein